MALLVLLAFQVFTLRVHLWYLMFKLRLPLVSIVAEILRMLIALIRFLGSLVTMSVSVMLPTGNLRTKTIPPLLFQMTLCLFGCLSLCEHSLDILSFKIVDRDVNQWIQRTIITLVEASVIVDGLRECKVLIGFGLVKPSFDFKTEILAWAFLGFLVWELFVEELAESKKLFSWQAVDWS